MVEAFVASKDVTLKFVDVPFVVVEYVDVRSLIVAMFEKRFVEVLLVAVVFPKYAFQRALAVPIRSVTSADGIKFEFHTPFAVSVCDESCPNTTKPFTIAPVVLTVPAT